MIQPPNPVNRARQYQEALDSGDCASYGAVGRRFGVSRIEVCHYVTILRRLPVDVVAVVESEADARRRRRFSLKRLLAIARLSDDARKSVAFAALIASLPPPREPSACMLSSTS